MRLMLILGMALLLIGSVYASLDVRIEGKSEFFVGDDLRKSDRTWMHKSRTIDKDKDQYSEIVTEPETGEVIHRCEEPLSKHRGHGSAKTKKDTDLSNK